MIRATEVTLRLATLGLVVFCASALAQTPPFSSTLFHGLQWRGIGPAATGGRIADIAVAKAPGRPEEIYVGTTSGGVFKSINGGVSFTSIFDQAGGMLSIGAVAVSPSNPSIVWVGTGEADNRQSSSWGDGIYKSLDGGATWQKMGLADTRHIARIVVHPTNPDILYVAALGHLWGSNSERGVFKTTDGGRTWTRVLYRDEHTGATDLLLDPSHPDTVWAAMYQRQRKGWGFNGGGPGSGIFRSTDGGASWSELTSGLPTGDKGRIGLAQFAGDPRMLYAVVEADPPIGRAASPEGPSPTPTGAFATARGGIFRSLDGGDTWQHLSTFNPRPMYYSRILVDPKEANRVYLLGSNRGFYISDDGGRTFRDVFSAVHSEDHALWIDPDNTSRLIIGGDGGVSISFDRGLSWLFRINLPIGQFYSVTTNNQEPFLACGGLQDNGTWCTPSATRVNYGVSFKDAINVGSGDGMKTLFLDDRTLLVSAQNGFLHRVDLGSMERQAIGPIAPEERRPTIPPYRWYWTTPLIASHFSSNVLYTGANHLFRSEDRGVTWKRISPDLTASIDREQLRMMGGDLVPPRALSRHDGQATFSALTAIAESPLDRNVLYTGADDGTLQMTRDGGKQWTNLTANLNGLPPMLNISGIEASRFSAGRVYLTVDGHFNDDYRPYIFVSEDYGRTWRSITEGLPEASVHVIREHSANPDFLVAGLESGAWASLDRGAHWVTVDPNLPPAPVYDLVFQQSTGALVLATHGRSFWVLDQASPLAGLTAEVLRGDGHLFPVRPARQRVIYNGQYWFGAGEFFAPNPPAGAVITYYLPRSSEPVRMVLMDTAGKPVRTLRGPATAGVNRACWDLRRDPAIVPSGPPSFAVCNATLSRGPGPLVPPGRYRLQVSASGGAEFTSEVIVEADPLFAISDGDRSRRNAAVMSAYRLQQQLFPAVETARSVAAQLASLRAELPAAEYERLMAALSRAQGGIAGAISAAATAQSAMDDYSGPPTAAQLRDLEWAWEDGVAAVTALNSLIRVEMSRLRPGQIPPVPTPARPSG